PAQATTCPDEKVDVNAASTDNLKKLPQIGVQRANAIVKARPYATPEDLLKKKVLKKAVYDKIKTCITASGVAAGASGVAAKGPAAPAAKTPSAAPVPLPTPAADPKPKQ
ncbi:MAG TPA: helix-hairpin-helix domain-containing protein, partial [Vineibacter sp.]|nr:helix-hairpin-helix domain-containing protein [Vineibacter sp.]